MRAMDGRAAIALSFFVEIRSILDGKLPQAGM
jgi:hypothetical protein